VVEAVGAVDGGVWWGQRGVGHRLAFPLACWSRLLVTSSDFGLPCYHGLVSIVHLLSCFLLPYALFDMDVFFLFLRILCKIVSCEIHA